MTKWAAAATRGRVRGCAGGLSAGRQMALRKYVRTPLLFQLPFSKEVNIAVILLENERVSSLAGEHNGFIPSWL